MKMFDDSDLGLIATGLTLVLATLKIGHILNISWWVVFFPCIAFTGIIIFLLIILIFLFLLGCVFNSRKTLKRNKKK